jgi:hypothetical protein
LFPKITKAVSSITRNILNHRNLQRVTVADAANISESAARHQHFAQIITVMWCMIETFNV